MKSFILASAAILLSSVVMAQDQEAIVVNTQSNNWKKDYRASATKINDLIHTKLEVTPDYNKCFLYGKEWVSLHPHFYPTDSLSLDAKGMQINEVAIVKNGKKTPLKYDYSDSMVLNIHLDKTYKSNETYLIYIDYVSRPNLYKGQGSAAITDAKGLYFINPDGKDKNKPIQLWTQGETEGSSVWFPTIDKPDQKTTEEIILTIPKKFNNYVSLSNGALISSKKNTDGTRTDHWKMDLPHAPYLFFFGVGDYSVIKDKYKGKEVNYYVEPAYASVARKIYGNTPEMMAFYSRILGVEFPWNKYSQMTARDYVSGAMENTTATLHTDAVQQNARELTDGNKFEEYVAHELFHQWFGDYVTCESWSNLTVNESFANYSETLWNTYKYGKDAGDKQNYDDMQGYLRSNSFDLDLVRFYYKTREDMFDVVSYNKGGRILHMLHHYLGDSAFYKSLNTYLVEHKFGTGEAHQLRIAFEKVTGQDLNWFWNQWYFGYGNPVVDISYGYDDAKKESTVTIHQTQKEHAFILPVDIDIYTNGAKKRYTVWTKDTLDTFTFPVTQKPDLINVDGDKILLWDKQDNKTLAEYAYQFTHGGNYVDRREAVEFASSQLDKPEALAIIMQGLNDKFYDIRSIALKSLSNSPVPPSPELIQKIELMAKTDPHRPTKADALGYLGMLRNPQYKSLFISDLKDSSYSVAGNALMGLARLDRDTALTLLPELNKDAKGTLAEVISNLSIFTFNDTQFDSLYTELKNVNLYKGVTPTINFIQYLNNVKNTDNFKKGVDLIIEKRKIYEPLSKQVAEVITTQLKQLEQAKTSNPATKEQGDYITEKLK